MLKENIVTTQQGHGVRVKPLQDLDDPGVGQGISDSSAFNANLQEIYDRVMEKEGYNYKGARQRVPSGLNIQAWRERLRFYQDRNLVEFLEYGWPINYDRESCLCTMLSNHASALGYPEHIDFYIDTEIGNDALAGPFEATDTSGIHLSPLMTRPKKDSDHRRVIMDLSWPPGFAVNDGINMDEYIDGPATVKLPTVEYMEGRILQLGKHAWLYKTDLARGYRQLRVDPHDWPLLGFSHRGKTYMDIEINGDS